jgi:hypothetical protein
MMPSSRRDFAKISLAALTAAALSPRWGQLRAADAPAAAAGKPNSKYAGVQIGMNVPYSFGKNDMSGDEILTNCVQLGFSALELRTQPVEAFLGAPKPAPKPIKSADVPTEVPKETPSETPKSISDWRKTAPIEKAAEFRKKYEDAGVLIQIVKVDGLFKMSDAELDYAFKLGKALGARALSTEISNNEKDSFADKHEFMVGYHGHGATKPEHWEKAFSLAKHNGANVDLGHFVAGNNISPVPFLKQYHDRITHVHVKDRKFNNGPNTPFGQGDTPIAEVLKLLRDSKWDIQATIEFEYGVPKGSTRLAEIARALKFCKDALTA